VAVAAIDSHRADVVGVAERDGLFAGFTLTGGVTRIRNQFEKRPTQAPDRQNRNDDTCSR
jgi:hypothetical protein